MKVKQYEESAFAGNKPLKILSIVEYDLVWLIVTYLHMRLIT